MKKISTFAAAAAVALAAAAPVAAEDAKVNSDPFVSSQGSLPLIAGLGTGGAIVAGTVLAVFTVAAIESSDDS
jgi:mevalonate kinase